MSELNGLQIYSAVVSGIFAGSLQDPLFLLLLLATIGAGLAVRRFWMVLIIAAVAAAIRITMATPDGGPLFGYALLAVGTIFLLAALIGRGLRHLATAVSHS